MLVTSDTLGRFFALFSSLLLGFFAQASAQNGAALAAAVEMTEYPIFTSGSSSLPWEIVNAGTFDGFDAIRSPSQFVGGSASDYTEISFFADVGTVSFYVQSSYIKYGVILVDEIGTSLNVSMGWTKFTFTISKNQTRIRIRHSGQEIPGIPAVLTLDNFQVVRSEARPKPISLHRVFENSITSFSGLEESILSRRPDSLYTLTALVTSEPENASIHSIESRGLLRHFFSFFVTDTTSASRPEQLGGIVLKALHYDLLRDLRKGDIASFTGTFGYDKIHGPFFEFSRYSKVQLPPTIYETRFRPLLAPIKVRPDFLSSSRTIGEENLYAKFVSFNGRHISIDTVSFLRHFRSDTLTKSIFKNGFQTQLLSFSNRFYVANFTEPLASFLNFRRPSEGPFFPNQGDLVNVRGFAHLVLSADPLLAIAPWNDGIRWQNSVRTMPTNAPKDIEILSSGIFLDSLRLSPSVPKPFEKPIARVLVQNPGEIPVDSVVLSYSIDNTQFKSIMTGDNNGWYNVELPQANNFGITFRLEATVHQSGTVKGVIGPVFAESIFRFKLREKEIVEERASALIGHYNADNVLDLAYITLNSIEVFAGAGDGTFPEKITSIMFGDKTPNKHEIISIDYDRDGKEEFIYQSYDYNLRSWVLCMAKPGNALETFTITPVAQWSHDGNLPTLFDGDSDGDLDFINRTQKSIYYSKNTGFGKNEISLLYTTSDIGISYRVGDITGDGVSDIVLGNLWNLILLKNDGQGNFTPVDLGIEAAYGIFNLEDIDGDGLTDILTYQIIPVTGALSRYRFYKNSGNGQFASARDLFENDGSNFVMVDVDSDGDKDFVRSANYTKPGQIELLLFDNGSVKPGGVFNKPNHDVRVLLGADLDHDGDADLATFIFDRSTAKQSIFILENQTKVSPTRASETAIPAAKFELEPAFPNPFNPTTNIRFRLAESARVQLDVFDLTGRRVAQLVNQFKEQGTHTFTFDARHLSSGMYLYKITALPISGKTAVFTQVRKMVLVK